MEERQYVLPEDGQPVEAFAEQGEAHQADREGESGFEAIVNAKLDAILAALGGRES